MNSAKRISLIIAAVVAIVVSGPANAQNRGRNERNHASGQVQNKSERGSYRQNPSGNVKDSRQDKGLSRQEPSKHTNDNRQGKRIQRGMVPHDNPYRKSGNCYEIRRGYGVNMMNWKVRDIEMMAYSLADDMHWELNLSECQYRRIVSYFKQQIAARINLEKRFANCSPYQRTQELERFVDKYDRKLRNILDHNQYIYWRYTHDINDIYYW